MTSETMPTIDRRRRTSDGATLCGDCNNIIPEGEAYIHDVSASGGLCVERNTCLDCLSKIKTDNAASWVLVIAASLAVVGAYCLAVGG